MASYAVESSRQPMTATGIVEPVREWEETADGRRRPSDRQARSEETGMPLWAVEVLYIQTSFGRKSTVTARVTIGGQDEPRPAPLTPVTFAGLTVETRVNKSGGFTESWSADHLVDPTDTRTGNDAGPGSATGTTSGTVSKPSGKPSGGEKAA